jgi:hypothetical protein
MKKNLKPCPACQQTIAKSATTCPHCGKSMTSVARIGLIVILVLAVLFIFGGGSYFAILQKANSDLEQIELRMKQSR